MILRPGPVSILYRGTGATTLSPIIVGTQPVWADDNDASYAVSEAPDRNGVIRNTTPQAVFMGFPSGEVTALTLTVRLSNTSAWAELQTDVEVRVPPVAEVDSSAPFFETITLAGTGIEEHTVSIPWDEAYRAGLSVNFFAVSLFAAGVAYGATSTIYDVSLDVTATSTKRPKPVRMYPANHPALGTRRQYPPARSRAAGRLNGYQ